VSVFLNQDDPGARLFRDRTNPLAELDDIDFHSRFRMNKRCFCNLLDRIELELHHATELHGGLLPIQQLVVSLRFFASASFFCKWQHALSCVFAVININDSFLMMRPSLM